MGSSIDPSHNSTHLIVIINQQGLTSFSSPVEIRWKWSKSTKLMTIGISQSVTGAPNMNNQYDWVLLFQLRNWLNWAGLLVQKDPGSDMSSMKRSLPKGLYDWIVVLKQTVIWYEIILTWSVQVLQDWVHLVNFVSLAGQFLSGTIHSHIKSPGAIQPVGRAWTSLKKWKSKQWDWPDQLRLWIINLGIVK